MTSRRLERLVRLKRLAEQARVNDLERERQGLDAARGALERTHAELENSSNSLPALTTGPELRALAEYQEHLNERATREISDIEERREAVRAREGAVRRAWSERRSLEGVHDRVAAREQHEERRREQNEIEELSLQGRNRRRTK